MFRARTTAAASFTTLSSIRTIASHGTEMHTNAPRAQPLKATDLNRLSFVSEVRPDTKTWSNPVGHPVWDVKDVEQVHVNHKPSGGVVDRSRVSLCYDFFLACDSQPRHLISLSCLLVSIFFVEFRITFLTRASVNARAMTIKTSHSVYNQQTPPRGVDFKRVILHITWARVNNHTCVQRVIRSPSKELSK